MKPIEALILEDSLIRNPVGINYRILRLRGSVGDVDKLCCVVAQISVESESYFLFARQGIAFELLRGHRDLAACGVLSDLLGVQHLEAPVGIEEDAAGIVGNCRTDAGHVALLRIARDCEILIRQILVNEFHNLLPNVVCRAAALCGYCLGNVVPRPNGADVIRGVAYEPAVVVGGRASGLSGAGHIGYLCGRACSDGHDLFHNVRHPVGRALVQENGLRLGNVVIDKRALGIVYP